LLWTGYQAVDDTVWARELIVIALSVMMPLDFKVPTELLLTYAP
jgi:protoheme IX farnesyltransferase